MTLMSMISLTSCCTHRHGSAGLKDINVQVDSAVTAVMGDSISSILSAAKHVKAIDKCISLPSNCDSVRNLKSDATNTLRFLIESPDNFVSDNPVYGYFNPSVIYIFNDGNREISILFDFGLKKWGIADASGKTFFTRDLKSNELLRFSRKLFPCDPLLESIDKK